MKHAFLTVTLLLLCVVGSCLTPGTARGADSATQASRAREAERFAAEAFDAHRSKDYARAIALYRQAYEAAPSADILWNLAYLFDVNVRNRGLAITLYGRYLVDPGAVPERIQKATERVQALRQAAFVQRTDARDAGLAKNRSESIQPGRSPMQPPALPLEGYWSTGRITALSVGAVGLAGMIIGVGYGLSALSDSGTAHEECAGDRCRSQRGVDAAQSATSKALVATLSLSAGAVMVAAGGVFWWTNRETASARPNTGASLRFTPLTIHSGLGLLASGSW